VALERSKVPVRQLYDEMFSNGRYDLQDQVFARDARVHFGDSRHISLEEAVAEGKGWRSAAPDLRMTVNDITVNGDMVYVDWTANGTHTGQGHGLRPSGRHVSVRGKSRFRVVNGKIVEAWNEEYRPELFRQLGVSRAQADMFFATEKILAVLDPIIPNRLYAALLQ
jgi:predicted ester cyclase